VQAASEEVEIAQQLARQGGLLPVFGGGDCFNDLFKGLSKIPSIGRGNSFAKARAITGMARMLPP
jgi:hypothetical protein